MRDKTWLLPLTVAFTLRITLYVKNWRDFCSVYYDFGAQYFTWLYRMCFRSNLPLVLFKLLSYLLAYELLLLCLDQLYHIINSNRSKANSISQSKKCMLSLAKGIGVFLMLLVSLKDLDIAMEMNVI